MTPKNCQKVVSGTILGSFFGAIFDQKSMPKMSPKNDESKIGFWSIVGRFWGAFWADFGDLFALDVQQTANG